MADLIQQYYNIAQQQYAANLTRQKQAEDIYDRIIGMYGVGGAYGAAAEALLGRQKVSDIGKVAQRDISRGLYGIRPYEEEWERGVGAEARLKLEDIKTERLSAALAGKAGFLERIEQPYPDYGTLQQAMAAEASVPTQPTQMPDWDEGGAERAAAENQAQAERYAAQLAQHEQRGQAEEARWRAMQATPSATPAITMAGGYGPAFQTQEEMAKIAGGVPTGMRYAPEVGFGAGVAPVPTVGGTTMTIRRYTDKATKTITVPANALGGVPAGFKDERTYKAYVPSQWAVVGFGGVK